MGDYARCLFVSTQLLIIAGHEAMYYELATILINFHIERCNAKFLKYSLRLQNHSPMPIENYNHPTSL